MTTRGDTNPLVDIAAVAFMLGVSVRYVRRLVAERRIPYVKFGHYLRFDRAAVTEWIDRSRVDEASQSRRGVGGGSE